MEKPDARQQLSSAIRGDRSAFSSLFESHRDRLQRMVAARMDPRLAARVSQSDVMQDVFVEAQRRIEDFEPDSVPLFVWLRSLTGQRLIQLFRFHVGAKKRSANCEVTAKPSRAEASSASMAGYFVAQLSSASEVAVRAELRDTVVSALDSLNETEREIISLRYFEQLSNEEIAMVLDLNPSTASSHHLRALKKLRRLFDADPSLADYFSQFGFGGT